jgi:hypothetical protein
MGFSTDNQSSPENADNEETPDMPMKQLRKLDEKVAIGRGRTPSKHKKHASSRRESTLMDNIDSGMNTMGSMFLFGPTQLIMGENNDSPLQPRRRKRSRKEFDRDNQLYRPNQEQADWDDSRPSSREGPSGKQNTPPIKEVGTIPAILSFIHQHPNLPHILSYYGQMLLSWGLIALFFYSFYQVWRAINHEVDLAVQDAAAAIMTESAKCLSEYQINKCGPEASTPPALRDSCAYWKDCFNRDPQAIGRASVSSKTFTKILNNFVEPMSWKLIVSNENSMGLLMLRHPIQSTVVFVILVLVSIPRALFGFLSKKHEAQMQPAYPPPPQFAPAHYMQSPYQTGYQQNPQDVYYTPRHQRFGDGYEHDMSPSKRNMSPSKIRHESPSKRLGYM